MSRINLNGRPRGIFTSYVLLAASSGLFSNANAANQGNEIGSKDSESAASLSLLAISQPSETAANPSTAQKVFSMLPGFLRSRLSIYSPLLRLQELTRLKKEVRDLLPLGTFEKMALVPQTSHDYLVHSLPDISTPKLSLLIDRNQIRRPELAPWQASNDVMEKEWFRRLGSAHAKLLEIQRLEAGIPETKDSERDATNLALALIECFSYGFEDALGGNYHWDEGVLGRANKAFLREGMNHLQAVLESFDAQKLGDKWTKLLLKFLIGKHAVNVAVETSHPGKYERSGKHVAPEPESAVARELAFRYLREVVEETNGSVDSNVGFSREFILNVESRYQLAQVESQYSPERVEQALFGSRDFTEKRKILQGILIDCMRIAPEEWVISEMHGHYGIIYRLVNNLRWATRDIDRAQSEALLAIERRLGTSKPIGYDEFIQELIRAGFNELATDILPDAGCEKIVTEG